MTAEGTPGFVWLEQVDRTIAGSERPVMIRVGAVTRLYSVDDHVLGDCCAVWLTDEECVIVKETPEEVAAKLKNPCDLCWGSGWADSNQCASCEGSSTDRTKSARQAAQPGGH